MNLQTVFVIKVHGMRRLAVNVELDMSLRSIACAYWTRPEMITRPFRLTLRQVVTPFGVHDLD